MKKVKIGNAAGFWGDDIQAASQLLTAEPDLDYLTLDYLAEVSLSIMALQKEKDPKLGYARDFVQVMQSLLPFWKAGSRCRVVTNAGGLNPRALGLDCKRLLQEAGVQLKVFVVSGDDVLTHMLNAPENQNYQNLDSHSPLRSVEKTLVTANAYLGAEPIVDALRQGADIVITGRVADPSLTVAPAMHTLNWPKDAYDKIAQATVAGHLIECGTQVTGGISNDWLKLKSRAEIGYPFVEIGEDGHFIISKAKRSDGKVTEMTVKEQLLYEIGDPGNYLSPDVTLSFLSIKVEKAGKDRVLVKGASGKAPPETYKVSATYRAGYKAEATLALFGRKVFEKAEQTAAVILAKVKQAGYVLEKSQIDIIGNGAVVKGFKPLKEPLECLLRIAVRDANKEAVEFFTKAFAPLVTAGAPGTTGYLSARAEVRPVFGYWPCLIARSSVKPLVEEV